MSTLDVLRYISKQYARGEISREDYEFRMKYILGLSTRGKIEKIAKQVLGRKRPSKDK